MLANTIYTASSGIENWNDVFNGDETLSEAQYIYIYFWVWFFITDHYYPRGTNSIESHGQTEGPKHKVNTVWLYNP